MSADVERALLVLMRGAVLAEADPRGVDPREPHEAQDIRLADFGSGPALGAVADTSVTEALRLLAVGVGSGRGADLTAGVQGLVFATRLRRFGADAAGDDVTPLAKALLASVGAEPERCDRLIEAADLLVEGEARLDGSPADRLVDAFGGRLRVTESMLRADMRTLSGPAALLAAQLVDLTHLYSGVACHVEEHDPPAGADDGVTSVVLETCTALPYETCRQRIDPRRWPDCNPYFASVTPIDPCPTTTNPTGWYGAVKELVGPGLNLSYYETDLGIRYVEGDGIAVAAFKLATVRHDDGRVTWDSGFLSVIDEGPHRRIQVAKDYRIIDLDPPLDWVCPLWASQVVVSGWACSCADSLRRALRAWSTVTRDVLAIGTRMCQRLHPDHPDHLAGGARRSRVGVLDLETFDLPASYDCPKSSVGRGVVRVPIPGTPPSGFAPSTAHLLTPESGVLTATPVQLQEVGAANLTGAGPAVEVELPANAAPGLYIGEVKDATGHPTAYTIYVSDAP